MKNVVTAIVALVMTACASHKTSPLCGLNTSAENNHLAITAKAFSALDSKCYLGKDFIKAGIQPLQIHIENNTANAYIFEPENVNLPLVPQAKVDYEMQTSALGLSFIKEVLTYPIFGIGSAVSVTVPNALSVSLPGSKMNIPLMQPPAAMGTNPKINKGYELKGGHVMVIGPRSFMNCIIFVDSQDFQRNFTITLKNQHSDQTIELKTNAS